jgi:predicted flap endonuclease-1-like 5' DNA nuclease
MNNQFEALVDSQKEMMEFWKKASQNMMEAFNRSTPPNGTNGHDTLDNWFQKQRSFFEDALKISDPKEAFEQAPAQLKRWMELQQDLAENYMGMFKGKANPMESFAKNWMQGSPMTGGTPFSQWNKQMKDNADWVQKNLMSKMPFPMHMHLNNFTDSYEELSRYWEPLKKMIQFGIYDEKAIEQFLPFEAYREIMGKFVGFKPTQNLGETIEHMKKMFDQFTESLHSYSPNMESMAENWRKYMDKIGSENTNPMFQIALEVNQAVKDSMGSLYYLSTPGKEVDMARVLNEIQFSYIAFLVKSAEMQSKVFQSGQFALPDTVKTFYQEYKESKELPEYKDFFNRFINRLENYMLEVLESDEYSVLQSEVAQLGVSVKARTDEMVELAFGDFPFLTNSHADEIAREMSMMRKKVRDMENRIHELEAEKKNEITKVPATDPQTALFQAIGESRAKGKDDLKQIKGIGPKLEKMLNSLGVYTFAQVSKITDREYELIDSMLSSFQGRGKRDQWAQQAKGLL